MAQAEKKDVDKRLAKALALPPERKFYFNGFALSMSASDVLISLEINGEPVIVINTSHTVGKALAEVLNHTVVSFEADTGYHIPTLKEMEERIQSINARSD